jgi:hypothetical protein
VDGGGTVTNLDADITTSNSLTLDHNSTTWGGNGVGGANDGFLLYKNVVGDFQSSIYVSNMTLAAGGPQAAYQMSGIMARLATYNGAGANGVNAETFISQTEFEEFGFIDILRIETAGADNNFGAGQPAVIPPSAGFLMVRTQGTNFTFYRRLSPTNAFTGPIASYTENLPLFAYGGTNVLEVGPASATYDVPSPNRTSVFSQFMLDLDTGPLLTVSAAGGILAISWDANDTFQHLYSTTNLFNSFTKVSGVTISTTNGISSVTLPMGKGNAYYQVGP